MQARRYQSLDALRGTAAIIVVLYHADALFHVGGWSPPLAFLSVDLFFCLSGFVLTKSYDRRFASGLTLFSFMRSRVQRLFPLYIVGWALGQVASLDQNGLSMTADSVITALLNAFMLPGPSNMFPTNTPSWSLFFELWVANALFAALWPYLHGWRLGTVVFASLLGLIAAERHFHDLNLGFEWAAALGGFARVMFSFFAGVACARLHDRHDHSVRVPTAFLIFMLISVLSFSGSGQLRQLQQIVCVVAVFPLIIFLGANASERRPKLGTILGDASYAIYVLHWPALAIATHLFNPLGGHLDGLVAQALLTLIILAAGLVIHHLYDSPIRRLFTLQGSQKASGR